MIIQVSSCVSDGCISRSTVVMTLRVCLEFLGFSLFNIIVVGVMAHCLVLQVQSLVMGWKDIQWDLSVSTCIVLLFMLKCGKNWTQCLCNCN